MDRYSLFNEIIITLFLQLLMILLTFFQDELCRIDQAILLSHCTDLRKNRPKDCLSLEEMAAYIDRVKLHPRNWMIHSTSLLLQCWCESESHHRAERAALQLEALIDQVGLAIFLVTVCFQCTLMIFFYPTIPLFL